ncbi:MAG: ParA family protein [Cetobacterium sp.]|uniref:ParA family protein n=1 Tax=Cetobacterium sp. TaxID=2071632 RepID=UPI003F2BB57F
MGKIISVKNNKGGVGKTFFTAQLASGLAYLEKKVLILTSDSQNNLFNFLYEESKQFKNGLKEEVKNGTGEYFRLRENLFFLPLEDNKFSSQFLKDLPRFLEKCKKEYDYILIDSTPVLKLDKVFLNESNDIIIIGFADEVTIEGMVNLLNEIDVKKVLSIVINKYKPTLVQTKYYQILKNDLKDLNINFPEPIQNLSFIEQILDKKKTIWEYNNKEAQAVQKVLLDIIKILEKR